MIMKVIALNEIKKLGIIVVILLVTLKIIFIESSIVTTTLTGIGYLWTMILPGYAIMYYWRGKISFGERVLIGSVLGMAILGITSYYIGLIGINIKYHAIIIPLIVFITAFIINGKIRKNTKENRTS